MTRCAARDLTPGSRFLHPGNGLIVETETVVRNGNKVEIYWHEHGDAQTGGVIDTSANVEFAVIVEGQRFNMLDFGVLVERLAGAAALSPAQIEEIYQRLDTHYGMLPDAGANKAVAVNDVRRLLAHIKSMEADTWCDSCAGTGIAGDRKCSCGGSGKVWDQRNYMRRRVLELETKLQRYSTLTPEVIETAIEACRRQLEKLR